ncbi:MAG: hypothetical protein MJY46_04300, partial [Bacteroidales bacterium]|nr:hypothetical protein [Bacteroidales bacterium]
TPIARMKILSTSRYTNPPSYPKCVVREFGTAKIKIFFNKSKFFWLVEKLIEKLSLIVPFPGI